MAEPKTGAADVLPNDGSAGAELPKIEFDAPVDDVVVSVELPKAGGAAVVLLLLLPNDGGAALLPPMLPNAGGAPLGWPKADVAMVPLPKAGAAFCADWPNCGATTAVFVPKSDEFDAVDAAG